MRGYLGLLGLLALLKHCICDDVFDFNGDMKDFVVSNSKLFVLTDHQLYQMRHDLYEEKRKDITNGAQVNILVPFEANGTLITCGTLKYCEVLDINDITNSVHYKSDILVGPRENKKSVAFIVNTSSDRFLLIGKKDKDANPQESSYPVVYLLNTLDSQFGGIFSMNAEGSSPFIQSSASDVEFIDGFQRVSHSELYLFLNTKTDSESEVILLKMDSSKREKEEIIRSLQTSGIHCCRDKVRPVLVSSAVISTEKAVLWAGVFSGQNQQDPENTALVLYDISIFHREVKGFCPNGEKLCAYERGIITVPSLELFKFSSMSSVAAVRNGVWIVLFVGTNDGQLLKLFLDTQTQKLTPSCPIVLYKSDDERAVLHRMHFDPDFRHIYIALRNQIRRVSVVQCNKHKTLRDCRAALDPLCGWCVNTQRCSTQAECTESLWISTPGDSVQGQLVSFWVLKAKSSKTITLHLILSLKSTGQPSVSCIFTTGSVKLCDGSDLTAVFPNCSCTFSDHLLNTGELNITASVTIKNQMITEILTLKDCLKMTDNSPNPSYTQCVKCISSGCYWSTPAKRCMWTDSYRGRPQLQNECEGLPSEAHYNEPEIFSLEPSKVSFHGRNNAVLRGRNLESVTKIRIQGALDCIPKESPVTSRSSDSLKFHIPPSDTKGTAKVCVVTPDNRCHGNSSITYSSQPICTGIQPKFSWRSGGRKIYVQGRNMEFVESVQFDYYDDSNEVLQAHYNSSTGELWFYSPQYSGQVSLKVGNSTVDCEFLSTSNLHFTGFTTLHVGSDLQVNIKKFPDLLNLKLNEVKVTALQGDQEYPCVLEKIEPNAVFCMIKEESGVAPGVNSLNISAGNYCVILIKGQGPAHLVFFSTVFLLIFSFFILIFCILLCIFHV